MECRRRCTVRNGEPEDAGLILRKGRRWSGTRLRDKRKAGKSALSKITSPSPMVISLLSLSSSSFNQQKKVRLSWEVDLDAHGIK